MLSHSQWVGLRESTQSGLCRTDRPYIPRLRPAREALPPDSTAQDELPGKESKRLSGGSRGQSPLAARAHASGELRSAATQRVSSSLDLDEINRYTNAFRELQKRGRKPYCGRRTWRGRSSDGATEKNIRGDCDTWLCGYCGGSSINSAFICSANTVARSSTSRFWNFIRVASPICTF